MQKWEYRIEYVQRGLSVRGGQKPSDWSKSLDLNKMGSEGWELISVVPQSDYAGVGQSGATTSLLFYFKRPIEE